MSTKSHIFLEIETIKLLKQLKSTHKVPSYEALMKILLDKTTKNEYFEDISHQEIDQNVKDSHRSTLKRIEALHTRIGFYEKEYFQKIDDISKNISSNHLEISQKLNLNGKPVPSEKTVEKSSDKSLERDLKLVEESHEILEKMNEEFSRKLSLLKSKIQKKSGVFANGYELNLTEVEFKNLF